MAHTPPTLILLLLTFISLCQCKIQAAGSYTSGWLSFPDVSDATKQDWAIGQDGGKFPLYQTKDDNKAIKRGVIIVHGLHRDCWNHFTYIKSALSDAVSQNKIALTSISLMAPCFFTKDDLPQLTKPDQVRYGKTSWIRGNKNNAPESLKKTLSAFTILDNLILHYMNRETYPNLATVVLVGHSAGGQMVQRYAALRPQSPDDQRLEFWIGNPGTLLWLIPSRPVPAGDECKDDFDKYKYGLGGNFIEYATNTDRKAITDLYRSRKVHYAWGLEDSKPGKDQSCPAKTQGASRVERGRNFVQMLEGMEGGLPETHSVTWVEGVGHSAPQMVQSKEALRQIFGA